MRREKKTEGRRRLRGFVRSAGLTGALWIRAQIRTLKVLTLKLLEFGVNIV